MKSEYSTHKKRRIWLDVSFSETSGAWVILPMHQPSSSKSRREFHQIEGNDIIYCVRGFDKFWQSKGFAMTYHKAKKDGLISRVRLD